MRQRVLVLAEMAARALRCDERHAGPDHPPLVGELIHDPELAAAFRDHFVMPRRARVREVVERGIRVGQLSADADVALLIDVGAAMFFHRLLVTGEALTDDLPERIIRQFVAPWSVSGETLDAEQRRPETDSQS